MAKVSFAFSYVLYKGNYFIIFYLKLNSFII